MAKEKFNNVALPNGTFIGNKRYVIYKKISSGGYGSVYLAKDVEKNVYCAIKEFLPTSIDCRRSDEYLPLTFVSDEEEERFRNSLKNFYFEAEVVAKFNHPNIIKIYDVFRENNTAYIVMPLEKGLSLFLLAHYHNRETGDRLPDYEIKDIFLQICDGIEFLHRNNHLHLDIKPGNIWIRPDGTVVILDLGSSRDMEKYQEQSTPAFTVGYAPPEQYKSVKKRKMDERTDIYAIGGCMKFCLETKSPIMSLKRTNDENYISDRFCQVNYKLLQIVDKCMQLNPNERYQNITELKKDLSEISLLDKNNRLSDNHNYISNFITPK